MLHKERQFTRFAVHIRHLYMYLRWVTPTLRVGFYPHKRTLLGTLRLRLCCRASSPICCADSGIFEMLANTDWPTILESGGSM